MRNIFDQYSQPENRITHALMTALNEDRKLLDAFLADFVQQFPVKKNGRLQITVQSYPETDEFDGIEEAEFERRGIPDAWITAGGDWCLVIENKVLSTPSVDQLDRHLATAAQRFGFAKPKALLLTVKQPRKRLREDVIVANWSSVYKWLQERTPRSKWAERFVAYLEVMEARLTNLGQMDSGTLTAFQGFKFEDNIFNYLEGKRVLGLAMTELRKRSDLSSGIAVDRTHKGRGAIRRQMGREVWDFLSFELSDDEKSATSAAASTKRPPHYTERPHLSLAINRDAVSAKVTLPNNAQSARRRFLARGEKGFQSVVDTVLDNMRRHPLLSDTAGMSPRLVVLQRHWRSRSAPPVSDAIIDIDLRTCSKASDKVKFQPEWIGAVFGALSNKNSNLELHIGAKFPYQTCKAIQEPEALDLVAAVWIACRPYISVLGVPVAGE